MNKSLTFSLSFLLAASLQAQLNKATLTGIVMDPSGTAIAGARITAKQPATNATFSTTTTATGNYALPALDIGSYRIETEAAGFKRSIRDAVTLASGATVRMDVTMEIGAVSEAASTGRQVMDGYNRRLEKSLSADDQTHVFRNALTYDLPIGEGKALALHGLTDKLLGSWSLSGFQDYESGVPYSVGPGISPVPTAGNRVSISSYTNWVATSGSFDPFKNVWWNKAAFGVNASGNPLSTAALNSGFGNATRNNPKARAPWIRNENVSLAKHFKVTESMRVTFRAEAFNLLNPVRWGGPDSSVTSPTFGIVRSQANTPRQMQFALKFNF